MTWASCRALAITESGKNASRIDEFISSEGTRFSMARRHMSGSEENGPVDLCQIGRTRPVNASRVHTRPIARIALSVMCWTQHGTMRRSQNTHKRETERSGGKMMREYD